MRRAFCLLIIAVLCGACDVTGPSPSDAFVVKNKDSERSSTLQVACLRSGGPVVDARVYQSEDNRTIIRADGYLERKVEITSDTTVYLMPNDQAQSQQYTLEAIYGRPDPLSVQEIQKIPVGDVGIIADQVLWKDLGFRDALLEMVKMYEKIQKSPKLLLQKELDGVNFRVRLDPNHWYFVLDPDAGAIAMATVVDGETTHGEMIFKCTECFFGDHLEKAIKHEAGHLLGYRGHPSTHDGVMGSSDPILVLLGKEELVFKYLFDRPVHTRPIDDSLPRAKATQSERVEVILCAIRPYP